MNLLAIQSLLDYTCKMPVTKTAKRALRGSQQKNLVNTQILAKLDVAIRKAKRDKKQKNLDVVFSLADRAAKKNVIHTKKANRIKARITKRIASV